MGSGGGEVGRYTGEEGCWLMSSASQSSKRISSPTVLWGELSRFGVGIRTLRKGGNSIRGGIGVGDGDINDKFSVPDHGDLRLKMDRVLANCTLSVEEGGVGFSLSVDSRMIGDGVSMLVGMGNDRAVMV